MLSFLQGVKLFIYIRVTSMFVISCVWVAVPRANPGAFRATATARGFYGRGSGGQGVRRFRDHGAGDWGK